MIYDVSQTDIKPSIRIKRDKTEALNVPIVINQTWSMDIMSYSLNIGRSIRTLHKIFHV